MPAALLLSWFLTIVAFGNVHPIPPDRAADSYAIYSQLLPLGETGAWPATYYDVSDKTITVVQPDAPCLVPDVTSPTDRAHIEEMNPQIAVSPPDKDKEAYQEILTDFNSHCHEQLSLSPTSWKARLPVHLLNDAEQREFGKSRQSGAPTAEKYKGSPALYAFSQVYFNAHHTVALVYATHWCGMLCGQGFWIALARENGGWKPLRWSSTSWIS
jgi:hypothetical protein